MGRYKKTTECPPRLLFFISYHSFLPLNTLHIYPQIKPQFTMLFKTIAVLFTAAVALATGSSDQCHHDNCDRAVINNSNPSAKAAHKAECIKAFQCTVQPAQPVTTVIKPGYSCTPVLKKAYPTAYQSSCPTAPSYIGSDDNVKKGCGWDVSRWKDACLKCDIFTPLTTTLATPTTTTATLYAAKTKGCYTPPYNGGGNNGGGNGGGNNGGGYGGGNNGGGNNGGGNNGGGNNGGGYGGGNNGGGNNGGGYNGR
jgi:hypothetical protein